jgi:hypothetical protein
MEQTSRDRFDPQEIDSQEVALLRRARDGEAFDRKGRRAQRES